MMASERTTVKGAAPTNPDGGTSRVRFIMVEAELADGDIGEITQAIQKALRPAPAAKKVGT